MSRKTESLTLIIWMIPLMRMSDSGTQDSWTAVIPEASETPEKSTLSLRIMISAPTKALVSKATVSVPLNRTTSRAKLPVSATTIVTDDGQVALVGAAIDQVYVVPIASVVKPVDNVILDFAVVPKDLTSTRQI
jgi:hypothetical protein